VSGHAKIPPASHQVSATSLKLLIQKTHPHVRVERDSGMCVAHDLYELWGRSPYASVNVFMRFLPVVTQTVLSLCIRGLPLVTQSVLNVCVHEGVTRDNPILIKPDLQERLHQLLGL
jgi:hypothetical protein